MNIKKTALIVLLSTGVIAFGYNIYKFFRWAAPADYKHFDLKTDGREAAIIKEQLFSLREKGWKEFRDKYVHEKCRNNPMLEHAVNELLKAQAVSLDSVDAFGKKIVRATVKAEISGEEQSFTFLLSRHGKRLLWETVN